MKITAVATVSALLCVTAPGLGIPRSDVVVSDATTQPHSLLISDLEKRRGGGGGGGRGGGGGGGTSGGGSGGRSGGSSGSSGSSRGGSSRTGSSSTSGGATRGGSGPRPAYGGGSYYSGGARSPYAAGRPSPLGLTPFLLPVAALAFFPGLWLYGAYAYPYHHHYNYTDENTDRNESLPVVCLCDKYSECGCDDNSNNTYYEDLFNGTQPANSSQVRVAEVNGTKTIYINGTLPNGTTADDPNADEAGSSATKMLETSGYWMVAAMVAGTVWGL